MNSVNAFVLTNFRPCIEAKFGNSKEYDSISTIKRASRRAIVVVLASIFVLLPQRAERVEVTKMLLLEMKRQKSGSRDPGAETRETTTATAATKDTPTEASESGKKRRSH